MNLDAFALDSIFAGELIRSRVANPLLSVERIGVDGDIALFYVARNLNRTQLIINSWKRSFKTSK